MGKGTAIKGNADIDLVLILNEVESAEDLKTKLPKIQGIIIHLLKENSRRLAILPETIKPTPFHVKFSVEGTYENINVDLLPSFHLTVRTSISMLLEYQSHFQKQIQIYCY